MAVTVNNVDPITIHPNAARYSLAIDRLAGKFGPRKRLSLQRAERTQVSENFATWIDDPRPDARVDIDLPESCYEAVNGLISILPTVVAANNPNITVNTVGDVRLSLTSSLDSNGTLDVSVMIQASIGPNQWLPVQSIRSLNTTLAANPTLIPVVMEKWLALDAAIDAHVASEEVL